MYSPEDGLPTPECRNCRFWNRYDLFCHHSKEKTDTSNGGSDCELHEYREPVGPDDYDDRYEKGE
jgi:hypothetical protein